MSKKQIVHPEINKTEITIRTVQEKDGITEEIEETVLLPSALFCDTEESNLDDK